MVGASTTPLLVELFVDIFQCTPPKTEWVCSRGFEPRSFRRRAMYQIDYPPNLISLQSSSRRDIYQLDYPTNLTPKQFLGRRGNFSSVGAASCALSVGSQERTTRVVLSRKASQLQKKSSPVSPSPPLPPLLIPDIHGQRI